MGVSLCRGMLGYLGSPLTGNFRDSWRTLERERLSLQELCWGRGLLSGEPEGQGEEAQGTAIAPLCHGGPVHWDL